MTPEQIDHVFGRGRLKMDTGAHVEVFREAVAPGESRRYTKRFLTTADGDYAQWTEREWRILALLIGHGSRCVPDIVQYDRDARGTKLVQTYDAGATVDQWATLLPVERGGGLYARVFEDCAHWWALAHHCLVALDEIHSLQLVHLDIKGDNICIPIGPADFDPAVRDGRLFPVFGKLRLIDFAFSLVSGESLSTPLPIGWQEDYDYQSPRLLHALEAGRAGDLRPTENLDWRCDMYSLAAMLKRYLPGERRLCQPELACGWAEERYDAAKALILRIREAHDSELTFRRPHSDLIVETSAHVRADELAKSLEQGWTLARDVQPFAVPATPLTPVTRLAVPLRLVIPPRDDVVAVLDALKSDEHRGALPHSAKRRKRAPLIAAAAAIAAIGMLPLVADGGAFWGDAARLVMDAGRTVSAAIKHVLDPDGATGATTTAQLGADRPAAPAESVIPEALPTPETVATMQGPATELEAVTSSAPARHDTVTATESSESAPGLAPSPEASPRESESVEPPHLSSASPSTQAAISSTALSASSPAIGVARGRQSESYRSKPVSPSSRVAKAPSSPTPPATSSPTPAATSSRASPPRPADASRRTQLAGVTQAPRATTPARATPTRSTPTLASKRATEAAFAALRVPPSVPSTPAASTVTVAPASASAADETQRALLALNAATVGPETATPNVVAASPAPEKFAVISGAQASPAPPAAALLPPQVPPVVETPRASPLATKVAPNSLRSAPLGEAPPLAAAPIVSSARPYAAPIVSPVRPYAAPIVSSARPYAAPIAEQPRSRASPGDVRDGDAYRAQARWMLENIVPRTSAQSLAQISRVLLIAASAYRPDQDRAVTAAATSPGVVNNVAFVARDFAPLDARRWHEEARHAYWSRRDIPDALDRELMAFGANPYDPEIAGQLAILYMKTVPAQPDRARQLALHAIGLRNGQGQSGQYQTVRTEDWTTFAIASALTGRDTDAKYGFYTLVALTRDTDRVCQVALGALATYGERLREPVDAMLYRLHTQGRGDDSPDCSWPASRVARYR